MLKRSTADSSSSLLIGEWTKSSFKASGYSTSLLGYGHYDSHMRKVFGHCYSHLKDVNVEAAVGLLNIADVTTARLSKLQNAFVVCDSAEKRARGYGSARKDWSNVTCVFVIALNNAALLINDGLSADRTYIVKDGNVELGSSLCSTCDYVADNALGLCSPIMKNCRRFVPLEQSTTPDYEAFFGRPPEPAHTVLYARAFKAARLSDGVWDPSVREQLTFEKQHRGARASTTRWLTNTLCSKCEFGEDRKKKRAFCRPDYCSGVVTQRCLIETVQQLPAWALLVYGHSRQPLNKQAIKTLFPTSFAPAGYITHRPINYLEKLGNAAKSASVIKAYNSGNKSWRFVSVCNNSRRFNATQYVTTFDEWLEAAGFNDPDSIEDAIAQLGWNSKSGDPVDQYVLAGIAKAFNEAATLYTCNSNCVTEASSNVTVSDGRDLSSPASLVSGIQRSANARAFTLAARDAVCKPAVERKRISLPIL